MDSTTNTNAIKFYEPEGTYACFTNYSQHPMIIDGVEFPTNEHYFQCCQFPNDKEYFEQIRTAKTCDEAQFLANQCGQKFPENWHTIKEQFMFKGILHQFQQHEDIRQVLLQTGDKPIIEDAPDDFYWGIGDGTGKNRLGHILMKVREQLLKQN